jgi:hypothetical protein
MEEMGRAGIFATGFFFYVAFDVVAVMFIVV